MRKKQRIFRHAIFTCNSFFCSSLQSSRAFTTNQEHLKSSMSVPTWQHASWCNNFMNIRFIITVKSLACRRLDSPFRWFQDRQNNLDSHPVESITKAHIMDNFPLEKGMTWQRYITKLCLWRKYFLDTSWRQQLRSFYRMQIGIWVKRYVWRGLEECFRI